jgi:hypothetical protein
MNGVSKNLDDSYDRGSEKSFESQAAKELLEVKNLR